MLDVRYRRSALWEPEEQQVANRLRDAVAAVESVRLEHCFYVETDRHLSVQESHVLDWLLSETFEPESFGSDTGLYDRLTARENIQYFADLFGLDAQCAAENIQELVEMLCMQDYIDRRVGDLSTGMKQKTAIARSIVHKPSIMLFDEPTAGLDVSSSKIVQDFIMKCREQGRAVLFSRLLVFIISY